jgi:SAM-dependent methyltransferase
MRAHDWTGFAALGTAFVGLVALARGAPAWALVSFVVAGAAAVLTRYWSRAHPAPMPHLLRWTLLVPRGNQSYEHLKRILEPRSDERILEIGPGIGIHALPVASWLAPDGTLDVLDVQQAMLDDLIRRARTAAITNITAKLGDARRLPYRDATFDAAYLVGVLGEVPDGYAVLQELRRVLKPAGRLCRRGRLRSGLRHLRVAPGAHGAREVRVRAEAGGLALLPRPLPPGVAHENRKQRLKDSPDSPRSVQPHVP